MAHGRQRPVVEVNDVELRFEIPLGERAEHAEARRVHEHSDLGLCLTERGMNHVKARRVEQIQREHAHLRAAALLQGFQPLAPARDDPELVENLVRIERVDKFSPHPGRCAGDQCNFHVLSLLTWTAYHFTQTIAIETEMAYDRGIFFSEVLL